MIKRILAYYRNPPTGPSVRFFAVTFPIWAIVTYCFLASTGFFTLASYDYTTRHLLVWLGIYLVMPSILEESIYRPVFFPLELQLISRSFVLRTAISTAIFALSHPINAYLFLPEDFLVFSDWRFLIAVGILGVYCSILLVYTKTIYYGILTHYIMVVTWKFVLCGHHVGAG